MVVKPHDSSQKVKGRTSSIVDAWEGAVTGVRLATRKGSKGRRRQHHRQPGGGRVAPRTQLKLARRGQVAPAVWELLHPRCAKERVEDIDEVRRMIEAGEPEVARDELRWLLAECSDCVDAHRLLGDLAAAEHDFKLARGHYGYVHQICTAALPRDGLQGTLPYALPGNRTFFESSLALAVCLQELGRTSQALELLDELRRFDPSDPLRLTDLWMTWSIGVQAIGNIGEVRSRKPEASS